MTYTLINDLGIESSKSHTQALCSGQRLLNSIDYIFSGVSALKKKKKDSTETRTMESSRKLKYFYLNLNSNFF